jgi:small GTP-binding protein
MATRAVPPPDYKMQMIIIGDSGVGKTSFMDRFVEGSHQVAYNATVGIDFKVKRVEIDQKTVKIQIWDTAGQEKFNAITTAYYRSG